MVVWLLQVLTDDLNSESQGRGKPMEVQAFTGEIQSTDGRLRMESRDD